MSAIEQLIIIGSGPAGHTAAIYAGRAMLEPLMFEGFLAGGVAAGGQLTTTNEVENFPGFPTGIDGTELMNLMRQQSINSGCRIETKTVEKVDMSSRPFKVYAQGEDTPRLAHSLIIATWATAKRLGLPGEETYRQRGISACAVCDGALPIYRNKHLIVIGAWDAAAEEATHLTKYATKVSMLVRSETMRASKVMQQRVLSNPKIEMLRNTEGVEIVGNEQWMTWLKIINNKTNETSILDAGGLFYAIGHKPNTGFLDGQLELDEAGYIVTKDHMSTKTTVDGVFAAGDVQDKKYRQAITSAGTGCMAALEVEHWLQGQTH